RRPCKVQKLGHAARERRIAAHEGDAMRVYALVVAVIALLLPTTAGAQISTATLTGTVIDESQALLPGAMLVATDVETGRKYETVSDVRGAYQFPPLPPGAYKIDRKSVV